MHSSTSCVGGSLQLVQQSKLLLQAQPSLQRLFDLLPQLWKLHMSCTSPDQPHHEPGVPDLTGSDSDAKHPQHAVAGHSKPELLWISTVLEWGPLCPQASVMHWAEALLQVSSSAGTA